MSAELKLKALAGGSLTLQVDDTLATDETMNISEGGIESGSNGNGYYTKFPDGTMMQYGLESSATASSRTLTFPIPFIDTNYTLTGNTIHSTTTSVHGVKVEGKTTAGATLYPLYTDANLVAFTTAPINWQAIGRWK